MSLRSRSGSSVVRTPWPSRAGLSAVTTLRTDSGPSSSPPWGREANPARRAMPKAAPNSLVVPTRSSFDKPKPMTLPGPSPAYCAANRARTRASRGCRIRDAATIIPTSTPVSRHACRASSRMISRAGVMPPTHGAYEVGSTCISRRTDPSFASSSTASRTMRRMADSERTRWRAES